MRNAEISSSRLLCPPTFLASWKSLGRPFWPDRERAALHPDAPGHGRALPFR
jgi:hypothetical protein